MTHIEFVSIDTETTGFHPEARIVEVAAVRYVNGREVDRFSALVNPGVPIPPKATAVNGITDEMVAAAPPAADVLPQLLWFIGTSRVVAHNAEFDLRVLDYELSLLGLKSLNNDVVCTLRMARTKLQLPSYRLGAVADHLGVAVDGAHRALADALTAGRTYVRLMECK